MNLIKCANALVKCGCIFNSVFIIHDAPFIMMFSFLFFRRKGSRNVELEIRIGYKHFLEIFMIQIRGLGVIELQANRHIFFF